MTLNNFSTFGNDVYTDMTNRITKSRIGTQQSDHPSSVHRYAMERNKAATSLDTDYYTAPGDAFPL